MSLSSPFVNDIPLSSVEPYDSGVFRTIESSFSFPYSRSDLEIPYDFFFTKNINPFFEKIYSNIQYLEGYSKLYNSILPIEKIECNEYSNTNLGFRITEDEELTFSLTEIKIYQKGILVQTINETQFGQFFEIRDVVFSDGGIFILDGNFIVKLIKENSLYVFSTFFGGLGSANSEYRFRDARKLIIDNNNLFVFDKGNELIKKYNQFLSFEENIATPDALMADVYDDNIYYATEDRIVSQNIPIKHNVLNPTMLELDRLQVGFIWIGNRTRLNKFALNGLKIYSNVKNDLSSFTRQNTTSFLIENGEVNKELDYQFTTSILSGSGLRYPLSAINIDPNEFNSDIVVNDSFVKTFEILNDFSQRITKRFVSVLDATSRFLEVTTEPFISSPLTFDPQMIHQHDEIISCHAWERTANSIFKILEENRDKLFGIEVFDSSVSAVTNSSTNDPSYINSINWSLGAQLCEGIQPQLFNPNFTPISLEELNIPSLSCHPLTGDSCVI